ncbi:MAG: cupin domain-containing protein [Actinomycetia bacterium]|nr:cupin domain-containing protein [Actinomycetes bacterium]
MKPVFSSDDIETTEFEDRRVKFAFGNRGFLASDSLGLGIVEFKPGTEPLAHSHDVDEALYVIKGKGKIEIENNWFSLDKGKFAHILKGETHRIESMQGHSLKILFIFGGKTKINY